MKYNHTVSSSLENTPAVKWTFTGTCVRDSRGQEATDASSMI